VLFGLLTLARRARIGGETEINQLLYILSSAIKSLM
jgi:hypothetical protein